MKRIIAFGAGGDIGVFLLIFSQSLTQHEKECST